MSDSFQFPKQARLWSKIMNKVLFIFLLLRGIMRYFQKDFPSWMQVAAHQNADRAWPLVLGQLNMQETQVYFHFLGANDNLNHSFRQINNWLWPESLIY